MQQQRDDDAEGVSSNGLSIAEQGQLAQQQHEHRLQQLQQQLHQTSNERQARIELAASRLRGSWVACMVHLNKQREEAAQRLLRQSSEARHAFNQSAHEMYNEVAPLLLAGVVHLIGNRNAADLVAFIGRSNTATVVGKLGSSSNVAVLEEIGPDGTLRVAGKLGFLGVIDVVQKLGLVGGAKLGYKMGRDAAAEMNRRLQGVVDDANQQLQSSSNGGSSSSASVLHLPDGRIQVDVRSSDGGDGDGDRRAAGGWQGVVRQAGSAVRLVGIVVLLLLLRAAVAGWRFGAAVVLNVRHAVRPSSADGRRDRRSNDAADDQMQIAAGSASRLEP
jgi:hypothetical protein